MKNPGYTQIGRKWLVVSVTNKLSFSRNVQPRLADRGTSDTGSTNLRCMVASMGEMDSVGTPTESSSRPVCALSLFVGYHFDHLEHWWAYIFLAIAGVIVTVMALREGIKKAAADSDKP